MTHRPTHQGKDERGAAALILLTTAIIVALLIFAAIVIPLALASDQKAKNRTAADASALAGATSLAESLRSDLLTNGWPGSWSAVLNRIDSGQSAANDFAARNDGSLTRYAVHGSLNEWLVSVTVEGAPVEGSVPRSEATAGLTLPSCTTSDVKPTPTPSPDNEDDEDNPNDEEEPKPSPRKVTCDGITVVLEPQGSAENPRYEIAAHQIDQLLKNLKPRLVA